MIGNFDKDDNAYPFGYMRSRNPYNSCADTPLYNVVDMRTLDIVGPHSYKLDVAAALAARINHAKRAAFPAEIDSGATLQQYTAELHGAA